MPVLFLIHDWEIMNVKGQLNASIYIGDLNIHELWYLLGILEPIPQGFQGATKFLGSQKLNFKCTEWGVGATNPYGVQWLTIYSHQGYYL